MTAMKLYHHPGSSNSRRVSVTAAHLGIELEHRLINLASPDDRKELVAINPNNKIPVLVDGDLVLWESHAIVQYLCDRTPGQTLYPTELRARADVQRWLYWTASQLGPAIGPINFERMWKRFVLGADAQPDQALVERHEHMVRQTAAVLDQHLAGRTWICGERLSLADISVASTLMYARQAQLPIDAYQHVTALVGRVQALDAWTATEPARVG